LCFVRFRGTSRIMKHNKSSCSQAFTDTESSIRQDAAYQHKTIILSTT
jgi:hypothetical protein